MEKPFLYTDLIPPDSTETPEDVLNVNGVIPVKMWNTGSPYKIDHLANLYLRNSVETATNESFEGMLNYISENMNFDDDNENDDKNEEEEEEEEEEEGDDEDNEGFVEQHIHQGEEDSNYEVESNIRNYFTNDGSSQEEADDVAYQSEEYEFDYEQPDEQAGEEEDEVNIDDVEDGDNENDDAGEDDEEGSFEDDENEQADEYDNDQADDQLDEREREMERVTAAFEDILASPRIQQYIEKKHLLGPNSVGSQNLNTNSVDSRAHVEDEDDASVAEDLLHIMSDYSELMTYLQSPRGDPALNPKAAAAGGMNSNASKSKLVRKLIADSPPQHSRVQQQQQFVITKEAPEGAVRKQPPPHQQQQGAKKKPPAGKDNKAAVGSKKGGTKGGKPTKAAPKRRQSPLTLITSDPNSRHPSSAALGEQQSFLSDQEEGSDDDDDFLQPVRMKPVAAAKKGKTQQPAASSRAKTEAGNKLKALLNDMVERRRIEEEEQTQLAEKAIAKRKKFKEALLEKAMKSRKIAEDNPDSEGHSPVPVHHAHHSAPISSSAPPGFLAPTHAFKVQSVVRTAKQVALTDEDLVRAEEAKHEHIAGIRRKFKEQHKKTLQSLGCKKKEEEKKLEDQQAAEQRKKEKHRLKIMQLLAAKHIDATNYHTLAATAEPLAEQKAFSPVERPPSERLVPERQNERQSKIPKPDKHRAARNTIDASDVSQHSPVAGGGLQAIRKRAVSSQRHSDSESNAKEAPLRSQSVKRQLNEPVDKNASSEAGVDDAAEVELRRMKKAAAKLQQAKISSYLTALADQKKKEEDDKKKAEDRKLRRVALLSARVLQEAVERKLMSTHDHPRHQMNSSAADEPVSTSGVFRRQNNHNEPSSAARHGTSSFAAASNAPLKPAATKVTPEMAEAIVNRLKARQTKGDSSAGTGGSNQPSNDSSAVPARDFNDWKRKNGVPSDAKVFAMTGWYPCVKQALLDRGWHFNADNASPYFHLKWTLRSIDVSQDTLQPWQLTNHYLKNVAITTKAGLIKSLQSLVWLADVHANDIIPRGYDLSIPVEMQAFIDDFRCQKADSILKRMYKQWTGLDQPPVSSSASEEMTSRVRPSSATSKKDVKDENETEEEDEDLGGHEHPSFVMPPAPALLSGVSLAECRLNPAVFDACCAILERQIKPYEDSYIDDQEHYDSSNLVSDLEWELVNSYPVDQPTKGGLPGDAPEPVDLFMREKDDPDVKASVAVQREKRRVQRAEQQARDEASDEVRGVRPATQDDLQRIHYILCSLMLHNRKQNIINGKGDASHNLWIVKPAAKSRGRGISTFIDLNKLLKYVDAGSGLSTQWVVQKYIENPLIIAKRKFDMRQWVVVTNWNPLTIYFYDEFYARFSVEEYSTEIADLENAFIHLVNNSIGKNSENFNKVVTAENGDVVDGYMWSFQSFTEYVKFHSKSDVDLVATKMQPRMKDIAKWSLMCASEMIEHRANSWELYGFDFMIDDEYNAWLIEINSSPACDYSTTTTERYVQKALVELLSVVLDTREWDEAPKKSRGARPDTGGWELIHQGSLLDMPAGSFGTDMSLKGEAYKTLPPKRQAPPPPVNTTSSDFLGRGGNTGPLSSEMSVGGSKQSGSLLPRPPPSVTSRNAEGGGIAGARQQQQQQVASSRIPQPHKGSTVRAGVSGGSKGLSPSSGHSAVGAEGGGGDFDDSDEEQREEQRGGGTRVGAKQVGGSKLPLPAKQQHQVIGGGPPTAAIPIKVFTVDF